MTTEMNILRLRTLRDWISQVEPDRFDMGIWWSDKEEYWDADHEVMLRTYDEAYGDCGTAGCLIGHACSIPEFREAGLSMVATTFGYQPNYQGWTDFDAAGRFFGLTYTQAHNLFSPASRWYSSRTSNGRNDVTVEMVIEQLDSILKEERARRDSKKAEE